MEEEVSCLLMRVLRVLFMDQYASRVCGAGPGPLTGMNGPDRADGRTEKINYMELRVGVTGRGLSPSSERTSGFRAA